VGGPVGLRDRHHARAAPRDRVGPPPPGQELPGPFDFRLARDYWGIDDPQVAFLVDAVLGGTAGYKPLITGTPPATADGLLDWLAGNALNPAHALFDETDYLLREDPRIRDKALYNSVQQC